MANSRANVGLVKFNSWNMLLLTWVVVNTLIPVTNGPQNVVQQLDILIKLSIVQ